MNSCVRTGKGGTAPVGEMEKAPHTENRATVIVSRFGAAKEPASALPGMSG